jgi:hypothetical protein
MLFYAGKEVAADELDTQLRKPSPAFALPPEVKSLVLQATNAEHGAQTQPLCLWPTRTWMPLLNVAEFEQN